MARYFGQTLRNEGHPPDPQPGPVSGMQPLRQQPTEAVMRAQDKVAPQSRRILWRVGLSGDTAWLVPNVDPTDSVQNYPLPDAARPVAPGRFDITPGCQVVARCLHLPSGPTNVEVLGSGWIPAGIQGVVQFICEFTASDATVETYTYVMPLDGSTLQFGAENTAPGGMQRSYRLAEIDLLPPVDLSDPVQRTRWSRPFALEIQINYVGSPRVVDLTIAEHPRFFMREADTADDEWTQHVVAQGDPDDPAPRPKYPVEEREDTGAGDRDQRLGTKQILRTIEAQRKRLGPCLFHWVPYTEAAAGINDTALPFITIGTAASLRWANALNVSQFATLSSAAAFEPSEPGWSMGCGGYVRQWRMNNAQVIPTQNVATAPVLLRVLADNQAAATATEVRLHTAPDDATASSANSQAAYSWISLTIPAATGSGPVWHDAWGYVTVGLNPEQHVVAQLMVQQATSGTDLDIYAIEAYVWDGNFEPL